ncbi:MAG TPA: MotA/TolQ/ExbB proton channel family protein [Methylocystis sp.]|nr:MotA/TolQ/ExbB proton channel family protein [Methylocystis sp.]
MSDTATTASAALAHTLTPIELFLQADPIVKTVIVLLIAAAAWGLAITAEKSVRLFILHRRAQRLFDSIQHGLPVSHLAESFAAESPNDPLVRVYRSMVEEYERSLDFAQSEAQRDALQERVHRVAQLASANAVDHLQARLPGLATIGSVSPFVGLFGTVWGIMNSFQGIAASNNTSLAVVAPGIAEALFATALGLVAAIPAVIFYNRISGEIGAYAKRLTAFIGVFEVELSRQLSKKGDRNGLRAA